jgi:hypothetical protein
MNFLASEMTCLRYFIPLIKEGDQRNVKSTVYWQNSNKYSCPSKHIDQFKKLSQDFNFDLKKCTEKINNKDLTFLIEGRGNQYFEGKKVALTSSTDFACEGGLYDQCIENIDYYIFPNKRWTEFDKFAPYPMDPTANPRLTNNAKPKLFNEKKNLYLGSPKYDVALDEQKIIKKYNLSKNKKCFLFYPRARDVHKIDLNKILNTLEKLGYEVLVKYRAKENCNLQATKSVRIFKDDSWYPHDSMELMHASDIVINTDSSGIKECVMLRKPVLNFKIKPFENALNFLYNEKFQLELTIPIDYSQIEEKINKLLTTKKEDFQETIDNFLFEPNSSKRILDFFKIT